jgi:phage tail protein X
VVLVKKGDQLTRLATEVYGFSNPAVLEWIKKHNPQLQDVNRVDIGMSLTLPPLPAGLR